LPALPACWLNPCYVAVIEPATDWANARGFLPVLDLSVDQPLQRTILVDKDLERIGDVVLGSGVNGARPTRARQRELASCGWFEFDVGGPSSAVGGGFVIHITNASFLKL